METKKQTQSLSFYFDSATTTNDISENINVPFDVTKIKVKTIVAKFIEPSTITEDYVFLLYSSMIPLNGILYAIPVPYYTVGAPEVSEHFESNPDVTFYLNTPTKINGTYTFGLRDLEFAKPSTYDVTIFVQLEFES